MVIRKSVLYMSLGLLGFVSFAAQADTLAVNLAGPVTATTAAGQSVTLLGSDSYNGLTFNWYDANHLPTAAGTLFVLDQEYLGKAEDLSDATPGFIAASQNIVGGQYLFDPGVILTGGSQFFFYTNRDLTFLGGGDKYGGGYAYMPINNDSQNSFISLPRLDANFLLTGNPVTPFANGRPAAVPEPSTIALLSGALFSGALFLRKRKAIS